jgi:hypothetical protein
MEIKLEISPKSNKKYRITIYDFHIDIGQIDYQYYIDHNNNNIKQLYITQNTNINCWTKKGILTNGFWERWLLWNNSTLEKSIKDTENRFDIKINSSLITNKSIPYNSTI